MILSEAIEHAKQHWQGRRKYPNNVGWANAMARALGPTTPLSDITTDMLILYRDSLTDLSPATLYARMSVASTLFDVAKESGEWDGTKPRIPYPHVPKPLQWWLNPTREKELMAWLTYGPTSGTASCRTSPTASSPSTSSDWRSTLCAYITWARLTGLRVEETLRLTHGDFFTDAQGRPYLTVPGTKTAGSQATLPLSDEAWTLATSLLAHGQPYLFPMTYRTLYRHWVQACRAMGWPDGALKALRRGYARERALKGMPLPIIQQMMRHASPGTTAGYLRLTGGEFTHEEVAQWL